MTDHLKLHTGDEGDGDVTRALREMYAAPQGDVYWRGLEARILSRLTESPTIAWWEELDRWMRPAIAAAAVIVVAAGVAVVRTYQVEEESTYEALLTPTSLPVETAVRPMLQDRRDGTFRYLMTSVNRNR